VFDHRFIQAYDMLIIILATAGITADALEVQIYFHVPTLFPASVIRQFKPTKVACKNG
jgi:hypothetical protein